MKKSVCIMVPARIASNRFPEKILQNFKGKPIINHVLEIANAVKEVCEFNFKRKSKVVLATDEYNQTLKEASELHEAEYFYMDDVVSCGSERIKYVYKKYPNYDYYISIPADEPAPEPWEIANAIKRLIERDEKAIYTLYSKFYCEEDLRSKNTCKVVVDQHHNILYTSRAMVPASKSGELHDLKTYNKHLGVFVFPKNILKKIRHSLWYNMQLNPKHVASLESLEQNMFIRNDVEFKGFKIKHYGFGVDSPEDLKRLEDRFNIQK